MHWGRRFSAMLAATVKTIAAGELGRADEVSPTATFVRAVGAAPPSTGLLRFALAEAHSTALQLLGWADAADAVNRIRDDDQPSDVYRWVEMMTGSVNLGRGRIDLAVRQLRDALSAHRPAFWVAGSAATTSTWRSPSRYAGGRRGDAVPEQAGVGAPARNSLVGADGNACAAWISAATGAVTRAIGEARSAAVTAASRGQPARGALPADCDEVRGHDDGDAAR